MRKTTRKESGDIFTGKGEMKSKDEIKTVPSYGRIFPKERDTDESVIFLKLKNLVKQAVISQQ